MGKGGGICSPVIGKENFYWSATEEKVNKEGLRNGIHELASPWKKFGGRHCDGVLIAFEEAIHRFH
jgi:hypothetical protein